MKVGIITVPDSSNCGSFLQAYGMMHYFKDKGDDVYFVRTRSEEYIRNLFYNNSLLIRSVIKWPIIGYKRWAFWRNLYIVFKGEWDKYFNIVDTDLDVFDLIVLGSDEIWNIKTHTFQNSLFFGDGHENSVAYAVSAGRATIDDFLGCNSYIELMRKIKRVFPRDDNTRRIADRFRDDESECVCDPTLLVDWSSIDRELPDSLKGLDYLVLYAYSVPKSIEKLIKRYAKLKRLKIVSVGMFCMWADINIPIKPLDMYEIFKNSKFVFTETFHGTVFSVLSESDFLTFPTGSIIKITDFVNKAGVNDRLVGPSISEDEFNTKVEQHHDYSKTNELLDNLRSKSKKLLNEAIKEIINDDKK